MAAVTLADPTDVLPGLEDHPHARAVLGPALAPGGSPSHAYLFHGPSGSGKRDVARAFAAALLSGETDEAGAIAQRIERGAHPDLTWVAPSGAAEMLVGDIDEAVVAAAARTPFEAARRVFVLEGVHAMNDQAANRMLKTLEEPPSFVHLLLVTDRREDVLATIASRCQQVRFDPAAPERMAAGLAGVGGERALACARLALGDGRLAGELASERGEELRGVVELFVRSLLAGRSGERRWIALLDLARAAGTGAGEEAEQRLERELELLARGERRRREREGQEARRRGERRARTRTLDLALRLAELWLRDVLCVCAGAPELIHAVDRREAVEEDAGGRDGVCVREGIELISDARLSLAVNVSEELALEALAYRLEELLLAS
jgi:DNA polymerase III subunit delta'